MKYFLLLFLIGAAVLTVEHSYAAQRLCIHITSPAQTVRLDEDVSIYVSVTNCGVSDLSLTNKSSYEPWKNFEFSVVRSDNVKPVATSAYSVTLDPLAASGRPIVLHLSPGQTLGNLISLKSVFTVTQPGEYRVQAHRAIDMWGIPDPASRNQEKQFFSNELPITFLENSR